MNNIYIGGDSFCSDRHHKDITWPSILANTMNLNLEGQGFPGCCWWETRKHLIDYIKSPKFNNTEYFIFVHTDFNRMLNDTHYTPHTHDPKIYEFYIKHLHSYDISTWHMHRWFDEIDKLLKSKKVINLYGFKQPYNSTVKPQGLNLNPSLIELSLAELNIDINDINCDYTQFINDTRYNHFSPNNNRRLAENIFQAIQSNQPEFRIHL